MVGVVGYFRGLSEWVRDVFGRVHGGVAVCCQMMLCMSCWREQFAIEWCHICITCLNGEQVVFEWCVGIMCSLSAAWLSVFRVLVDLC